MVKIPSFHCRGHGLIPGQGTKIPHKLSGRAKKNKKTNKKTLDISMHSTLIEYLLGTWIDIRKNAKDKVEGSEFTPIKCYFTSSEANSSDIEVASAIS